MYTIVQNYLSNSEYDYTHEYETKESAMAQIQEYEQEDIDEKRGAFEYTILDKDFEQVFSNLDNIKLPTGFKL